MAATSSGPELRNQARWAPCARRRVRQARSIDAGTGGSERQPARGWRTQEFGVRLDLGAEPRSILTLAIRQGVVLVVAGLGFGVVGAIAVTRYLQGLLFGLTALDVRSYAIVIGLFGAVALVACYAPARRATSISPLEAVKYEYARHCGHRAMPLWKTL